MNENETCSHLHTKVLVRRLLLLLRRHIKNNTQGKTLTLIDLKRKQVQNTASKTKEEDDEKEEKFDEIHGKVVEILCQRTSYLSFRKLMSNLNGFIGNFPLEKYITNVSIQCIILINDKN